MNELNLDELVAMADRLLDSEGVFEINRRGVTLYSDEFLEVFKTYDQVIWDEEYEILTAKYRGTRFMAMRRR